jgi:hypothetical protein
MWYNIRARDIGMDRVLEFWLFADNREKLDELLQRNQYDNVEWAKEKIPPWGNGNKKENHDD